MGKSTYVTYFQENLRICIEKLLKDLHYDNLKVISENRGLDGSFNGAVDVCIVNDLDSTSVLGIEIEHKSGYKNALRNIEKLKKWTHNSTYRSCGLLHIFNEECNISENNIVNLVSYAKINENKGLGFYYDYMFYDVVDSRETYRNPENLVNTKEFRARLKILLEMTGVSNT